MHIACNSVINAANFVADAKFEERNAEWRAAASAAAAAAHTARLAALDADEKRMRAAPRSALSRPQSARAGVDLSIPSGGVAEATTWATRAAHKGAAITTRTLTVHR